MAAWWRSASSCKEHQGAWTRIANGSSHCVQELSISILPADRQVIKAHGRTGEDRSRNRLSADLWWPPVMATHPPVRKVMAPGRASSMEAATVFRNSASASSLQRLLAFFSSSAVRLKEQYLRPRYMICKILGLHSQWPTVLSRSLFPCTAFQHSIGLAVLSIGPIPPWMNDPLFAEKLTQDSRLSALQHSI